MDSFIWVKDNVKLYDGTREAVFSRENQCLMRAKIRFTEEFKGETSLSKVMLHDRRGFRAYASLELIYYKESQQTQFLNVIDLINTNAMHLMCNYDTIPIDLGAVLLNSKIKQELIEDYGYYGAKWTLEFVSVELVDDVPDTHDLDLPFYEIYKTEGLFTRDTIQVASTKVAGYNNLVTETEDIYQATDASRPLIGGAGDHIGASFLYTSDRNLPGDTMAAFIGAAKKFTIILGVGYNSVNHRKGVFIQFNDAASKYFQIATTDNVGHLNVYSGKLSQGSSAQFCQTTQTLPAGTNPILIAVSYDGANTLKVLPGRNAAVETFTFNKLTSQALTMKIGRGFLWQGNDELGDFRFQLLQICSTNIDLESYEAGRLLDWLEAKL